MAEMRSNMMQRNGYGCQNNPGMNMNFRGNVNNNQRMMYKRPEPPCEEKKEPKRVKADNYQVGMAYVPWQNWKEVYELDKALHSGTIFPELDKDFYFAGGGCR